MSALAHDFSHSLPLKAARSYQPLRIAVIGGGAASAIQVGELLRRHRGPLSIDWYAGCAEPGRGVAYGTAHAHHLLNVRVAAMGLFADDTGGFLIICTRAVWMSPAATSCRALTTAIICSTRCRN